jgi:hypothetical protein
MEMTPDPVPDEPGEAGDPVEEPEGEGEPEEEAV